MVGEEARVLHLLLGPAKFEEVVWRIEPLLHLHVPFHHNTMEGPIDCPHTFHLLVLLQCSQHLAAKGVKSSLMNVLRWLSMERSVFFFRIISIFVSRRTNLTMIGRSCTERDFCRRWLTQMSCSSIRTPMSLAMAITTSLVFSSAVSGTPCSRTFSRRLYWASRPSSNACDCRAERRWPTSFVKRSFSAAMLASS